MQWQNHSDIRKKFPIKCYLKLFWMWLWRNKPLRSSEWGPAARVVCCSSVLAFCKGKELKNELLMHDLGFAWMPFFSHELSGKASTRAPASNKVIINWSRGGVSPVEEDTIECVFLTFMLRKFLKYFKIFFWSWNHKKNLPSKIAYFTTHVKIWVLSTARRPKTIPNLKYCFWLTARLI